MMSAPLYALDTVPPALLRRRRTALTPTWGDVCFAVEVLALDLQVLDRQMRSGGDRLHAIVDDLPEFIAGRGVDDGWVLPIDISDLFAAEADTDGLLDLHREMAGSDIGDPDVARALSVRMSGQRRALIERKNELQEEIDRIQELLLRQYATGAASIDDWLD
jgi:hypothetical protein